LFSADPSQKNYLAQFCIEDVITLVSGQLLMARTLDGSRYILQEIQLRRALPPGFEMVLRHLDHPHLPKIVDVLEEADSVVLVHPPLTGEPLSLLVNEKNVMHPMKSLEIFRKLLRTLLDLNRLPLPLGTTLDPRNIIMDGDHPYLLVIHFKHFSGYQEDERWRELLFFLLTGERPDRNRLEKQWERVQHRIPPEMQPLVRDCFDMDKGISEILSKASKIQWNRARVQNKRISKRVVFSTSMAALLVFGAIVGYQVASQASLQKKPLDQTVIAQQGQNVDLPFSAMRFDGSGSFQPVTFKATDGAWIRFHVSVPESGWPLVVRLGSTPDAPTITIQKEEEPLIWEVWESGETGTYEAQMEILLLPRQPVRFALSDPEGEWKWMAAAPSIDSVPSEVNLSGGDGVSITEGVVRSLARSEDVAASWNEGLPWSLVRGEALIKEGKWTLGAGSVATVRPDAPITLTYRPRSDRQAQLIMEWELNQGDPLRLVVKSDGMTLFRMGRQPVPLRKQSFKQRLRPGRNTFVSVSVDDGLNVYLQQGRNAATLVHPLPADQLSSAKISAMRQTVLTQTPQLPSREVQR
jgi:hypothetical protein